MSESNNNLDGSWYIESQLNIDKKMLFYRYQTIKKYFKGSQCLELGSAEGEMTRHLVKDFKSLTSVDASKELLDSIPNYGNLEKIHSFFETFSPQKQYDTIIMEHILEHVEEPVKLLKKVKHWLKDQGVLIVGVPNALSFHRLAAVKMGLLTSSFDLNDRDHALGHRRVYCFSTLLRDLRKAALDPVATGGIFLKPLSNGQMENTWTNEMLEGFYQLGKDFPENAAEIYAICEHKK